MLSLSVKGIFSSVNGLTPNFKVYARLRWELISSKGIAWRFLWKKYVKKNLISQQAFGWPHPQIFHFFTLIFLSKFDQFRCEVFVADILFKKNNQNLKANLIYCYGVVNCRSYLEEVLKKNQETFCYLFCEKNVCFL